MKRALIATLALAGAGSLPAYSQLPANGVNALIVHEWGTFTSLQGSDGEIQPGMQHEEEALPGFVHGRDPVHEVRRDPHCRSFKCMEVNPEKMDRFTVTQKMETPVIYFYSPTAQKVKVDVGFPNGIISQYYPAPASFNPAIGEVSRIGDGKVSFDLEIVKTPLAIPSVSAGSVYAPSRKVNSDFVRSSSGENEKFVFYRGLGHFYANMRVGSSEGAHSISSGDHVSAAFLVDSGEDGGAILPVKFYDHDAAVSAEQIRELRSSHVSFSQFTEKAARTLGVALEKSGLYADEARAMVDTWKKSYFRTPGLRLLYILSRAETDRILPMTVQPAPAELVRTMVGRVEVLLDTEENAIIDDLREHGEKIAPLGRFAEPKLRRVRERLESEPDAQKLAPIVDRLISCAQAER